MKIFDEITYELISLGFGWSWFLVAFCYYHTPRYKIYIEEILRRIYIVVSSNRIWYGRCYTVDDDVDCVDCERIKWKLRWKNYKNCVCISKWYSILLVVARLSGINSIDGKLFLLVAETRPIMRSKLIYVVQTQSSCLFANTSLIVVVRQFWQIMIRAYR
jgi:hypothetical protein